MGVIGSRVASSQLPVAVRHSPFATIRQKQFKSNLVGLQQARVSWLNTQTRTTKVKLYRIALNLTRNLPQDVRVGRSELCVRMSFPLMIVLARCARERVARKSMGANARERASERKNAQNESGRPQRTRGTLWFVPLVQQRAAGPLERKQTARAAVKQDAHEARPRKK